MVVIKSLVKIYLLKNVDFPEYYFDGNVEFPRESWKNQGLASALSEKNHSE
jgi:hypothetical protein